MPDMFEELQVAPSAGLACERETSPRVKDIADHIKEFDFFLKASEGH